MVNKKGWLRILEASIAVFIILGMLFFLSQSKRATNSNDLTGNLRPILEEISENYSLRSNITNYFTANTPSSEQILSNLAILNTVNSFVGTRIKNSYFNYTVRICNAAEVCGLENYPSDSKGDIFAAERLVSSDLSSEQFDPKKIKIFVWRRNV